MVKTRLDRSMYFIFAELRSAHVLLSPATQKICHTQFYNLILLSDFCLPPTITLYSFSESEKASSSFYYQTLQLLSFGKTPWSLMSIKGGVACDTRSDKWKCVLTTNSNQSKCYKWTKESSDWQSPGWERTHIKGEILYLLLLVFA